MPEPVMQLQTLGFAYRPEEPVLEQIDAALPAGRVCCLLGPNAAGKSTLMRLMLGRHVPTVGWALLDGQDVARLDPRERAQRVSYVPQAGRVAFGYTVRELVGMARYAAGDEAEEAIERAMRVCDLTHLADRIYTELSAGQQQRVLIARAVVQSAGAGRLMLLDEPGTGLDLAHLHAAMRLLREQAARGLAVLAVLHDLNLAARYADDIWLLSEGRLAAAGPWHRVMRPDVLEPVYGLPLRAMKDKATGRLLFIADDSDRLNESSNTKVSSSGAADVH